MVGANFTLTWLQHIQAGYKENWYYCECKSIYKALIMVRAHVVLELV